MRFNEGLQTAEFEQVLSLARQCGLKTLAEVERFMHSEVCQGESVVTALRRCKQEQERSEAVVESVRRHHRRR